MIYKDRTCEDYSCAGCVYHYLACWEAPCAGCCPAHSGYEPVGMEETDEQT